MMIGLLINVVVGIQTFMGSWGIATFAYIGFMALGAYAAALLSMPATVRATSIPAPPDFLREMVLGFLPAIIMTVLLASGVTLLVGVAIAKVSGAAATIADYGVLINRVGPSDRERFTRGAETFYGIPSLTTLSVAHGEDLLTLITAHLFRDSRVGME